MTQELYDRISRGLYAARTVYGEDSWQYQMAHIIWKQAHRDYIEVERRLMNLVYYDNLLYRVEEQLAAMEDR